MTWPFFQAGRDSKPAKPEEQEVRVDTKRRMKKQWNDWGGTRSAQQVEGLSKEGRKRPSAFDGEQKAYKKEEESISNEKTSFASILFKAIAEFYTEKELEGEEREAPTRDKPKVAKPSPGLWRGPVVKLKGRHGHQHRGKPAWHWEPAQEHLTGMSEQILVLFQRRDRRHIRRKYIPLGILKWMVELQVVCNKEAKIPPKCHLYKLCYFDVCTALLRSC